MRKRVTTNELTVQAIAGSHVVLLGISLPESACTGLLGFAVHRTDHIEEEAYWLEGLKTFADTDPGFLPGAKYSTRDHPVQGFTWSDFTAKPGRRYTYRVAALKGAPSALQSFRETAVEVTTEAEADGVHDVFFNRGAAASQEYARRFGTPPDENNSADPRWAWLSRGAMEALEAFVARAVDNTWAIRVAAYEFRLSRFAEILRLAHERGADVRILFDACNNPPDENGVVFPRDPNRAMAQAEDVTALCSDRITRDDVVKPPIGHHKFIVLLHNGQPTAVLTGSTNFSLGGAFGQSNLVHIVDDPQVAAAYLQCWTLISTNPDHQTLRADLTTLNDLPTGLPPQGTRVIFSPQQTLDALTWYAKLVSTATDAVFMTFAFGMGKIFKEAYRSGAARLRYAMLDKLLPPGIRKENRPAAEQEMLDLRKMKENRFAVGSRIAVNSFDRWVKERLTGLNSHVQYIHTKFLLINPLSADPIVVTGSANFSEASTKANDENMLVIRGDTRVADIYLGEYMRLWNHYAFREWASSKASPQNVAFRHLDPTDGWTAEYFGDSDRSRQRQYFSGEV
jgi:phosphatidylserine/phosphatidylglycerophosphate/cardiolipin synthase-like enzyme